MENAEGSRVFDRDGKMDVCVRRETMRGADEGCENAKA
jgi:hypothetical protein